MILRQIYKILFLTELILTRMALKKTVNANASTFTLVGEFSGCFSLKHVSWSFQIIPKIRELYCKSHSYSTKRKMYRLLALVILRESMHEFGRITLIPAPELNAKSNQGLPAASVALVSPVSLCSTAAPCQTSQEAGVSLTHRGHSIRLPACTKRSMSPINISAIVH